MKALVLYYSRTGATRFVAELIAKELKCDIEEVKEPIDRTGVIGYIKAGKDAMTKKKSEIIKLKSAPDKYDTIIIGQPVWGWTMVPAIRGLLDKYALKSRVALFCTMDGSGDKGCFKETRKMLLGSRILGQVAFIKPIKNKANTLSRVKDFIVLLHTSWQDSQGSQ